VVVKRCKRISSRAESVFSGKMITTCSCSQELISEVATDNLVWAPILDSRAFL
jgi:hypothetical protein